MRAGRARAIAAATATVVAGALATSPPSARAFCGFYVSGGGQELYNNATMVVMMREGTRTVLSMQNDYEGPPEDFAMVVPVPVVLQKDNVKTLPDEVFERVDRLAAPRLVEYWEQDPCEPRRRPRGTLRRRSARSESARTGGAAPRDLGVTVEAEFDVGEYQIVILSADDSAGLDTWLEQEGYNIPDGAEPLLRPYVEEGSKFFVAKVDVEKVRFEDNQAMLSPLRFHYDADEFRLPVRLGLMNAKGKQDLIVHILAKGQRYAVANYDNVTIPTNIDVAEDARDKFGAFYVALFDRTLERNPGAVVTEYAWNASSCDPCPTPALKPSELMTLGGDVLPSAEDSESDDDPFAGLPGVAKKQPARGARRRRPSTHLRGFVLTRLHARYDTEQLGEDLVFKEAPPIQGGRERRDADGELELGSQRGSMNNFQARYAIRHPWKGPIDCDNPRRGRWGGPPGGKAERDPEPARNLASAPRGEVTLASMVESAIPEAGVEPADDDETERQQAADEEQESEDEGEEEDEQQVESTPGSVSGNETAEDDGCGSCSASPARGAANVLLAFIGLAAWLARRRR